MLREFLTLVLWVFAIAFVIYYAIYYAIYKDFRLDVKGFFRRNLTRVKKWYERFLGMDYDEDYERLMSSLADRCMNDGCHCYEDDDDRFKVDFYEDDDEEEEDMSEDKTRQIYNLRGAGREYKSIRDMVADRLSAHENDKGYDRVIIAAWRVITETDKCVKLYECGEKFAKAGLWETLAPDAMILIYANVNRALEQVKDHLDRAPYSAENSAAIADSLELIERKIAALKSTLDVVVRKLVYRPLGDDELKTTFDAGFEDLKGMNLAKIRELEQQIQDAQAAIKDAEAAIREFEQLSETLSGDDELSQDDTATPDDTEEDDEAAN